MSALTLRRVPLPGFFFHPVHFFQSTSDRLIVLATGQTGKHTARATKERMLRHFTCVGASFSPSALTNTAASFTASQLRTIPGQTERQNWSCARWGGMGLRGAKDSRKRYRIWTAGMKECSSSLAFLGCGVVSLALAQTEGNYPLRWTSPQPRPIFPYSFL